MRPAKNCGRWNPEAVAFTISALLWFLHGGLLGVSKGFVYTWAAHWLIVGVWGYSYLWRFGNSKARGPKASQASR